MKIRRTTPTPNIFEILWKGKMQIRPIPNTFETLFDLNCDTVFIMGRKALLAKFIACNGWNKVERMRENTSKVVGWDIFDANNVQRGMVFFDWDDMATFVVDWGELEIKPHEMLINQ